jgi:hypothetical protein
MFSRSGRHGGWLTVAGHRITMAGKHSARHGGRNAVAAQIQSCSSSSSPNTKIKNMMKNKKYSKDH